jgi:tungstate transport system substrate-binding protein
MRKGLPILQIQLAVCFIAQDARPQSNVVRVAVVNTPEESGLLREILPDFERQTGMRVEVYSGEDLYDRARNGQADIVISHYGHPGVEPFIADGLGLWPRFVFGNQNAIVGPSSDPARVRDLTDAVEGFRRIAQSRSPFVANNSGIPKYTEDLLWEAAGRPPKQGWYVDLGSREQAAVQAAAERGAYTIWGLVPFLRYVQQNPVDLRALLVNDAILSRMMVSVVVRPERFPQANVEGAKALEKYLLVPSTQARIRAFRYPGLDHALWWPSARENTTTALGYGPEGAVGPQPAPAISPGGVVNAADRRAGVRPGSVVEIYGANFAVGTCSADALPWPTQLPCSPTRVSVSGRDAPLLYVSPVQVNAQIPPGLSPGGVTVTVIRGMAQSNAVALTLVP